MTAQANAWQAIEGDAALACLGHGLPPAAEEQLRLAGLVYADDHRAREHLRRAQALAPDHAAVLIAQYRFYFYKGRLADALAVAQDCLGRAATALGLDADWRRVRPDDAPFAGYDAILARFYLFTLKAWGYLQMRLGRLEEGRAAITKLRELDPEDKLGGKVLLDVCERAGRDDD